MVTFVEIDDLQDGYLKVVEQVLKHGKRRSPRGIPTIDVGFTVIELKDPSRAIPIGVGRRPNMRIGAAEVMQFIAGLSHPKMLSSISSNFNQFIEFDRMYGAYGPRIYPQYPFVIDLFNSDPDTRQGVVAIYRPDDIVLTTRDVPCTLDVRYAINNNKLDCNVVMRSNDVVWGLAYDAWVFTAAQHALAYALGVDVGTYVHCALSLHIYDKRDQKILDGLHQYDGSVHPHYPFVPKKTGNISHHRRVARWKFMRNVAEGVLGTRDIAGTHLRTPSVEWYREQLSDVLHCDTHSLCQTCRVVLPHHYFYGGNHALCKWCDRDVRHKLPIGTYARMMLTQQGKCAICEKIDNLYLDHCHDTGVGRGLLCDTCSKALGLFYDEPKNALRAAQYLEVDVNANTWTTDFSFLYRARPRDVNRYDD